MILIIDNYDSFTHNLVDYFEQLGQLCHVIQNDLPVDLSLIEKIDGIVFSPGPGNPDSAGNLLSWIKEAEAKIPMLGICLGHQALCQYFGGKIGQAIRPMHGKISKVHRVDDDLFKNVPDYFNVVRYHSLICHSLPTELKLLAFTEENEPMAFRHTSLAVYGLQFHPEAALTEYGVTILKNWLRLIGKPD